MAVNLQQTKSFNISAAVQARLQAFSRGRQEAQSSQELKFYQEVAGGMSYEAQLAYREGQIAKEEARNVPDKTYIQALQKEASTLKKTLKSEYLKNAYLDSFDKLSTGLETFDQHVNFLKKQLAGTADPELQSTIREYLSDAVAAQYKQENQIRDNYYTYALNDRTVPVLEKALKDAENESAKALGSGDESRYSVLQLKRQSLSQAIAAASIEKQVHEFDLKKLRAYNPAEALDMFSENISSSDDNVPVTIGGQQYASAKEYWQLSMQDYISGGQFNNALTNYYGDMAQEMFNKSQTAFPSQLKLVADDMNSLLNRADVGDYKQIIQGAISGMLSKLSDTAAKTILDNAEINSDYQTAADRLAKLTQDTGVDQTANYNQLLTKLAKVKLEDVQAIQQLAANYEGNGLSTEQALNKAIQDYSTGAYTQPTTEELATKTAPEVIKQTESATAPSTQTLKTPSTFKQYNEGDLLKLPNDATVYQFTNGQVRAIGSSSGTVSDTMLKTATGKTFSDVQTVNDFGNLQKGQDLILKTPPKVYRTKAGQQYGSFAPQTEFVLEGSTLRPISSQQAKQQVAPGVMAEEADLNFFNQYKIGQNY